MGDSKIIHYLAIVNAVFHTDRYALAENFSLFLSEDDYRTGCRDISHIQQGLHVPVVDHIPLTYKMTPGFKQESVILSLFK